MGEFGRGTDVNGLVTGPGLRVARFITAIVASCLLAITPLRAAEPAKFFRGLNLNGPPLTIDGQQWDGQDSPDYRSPDKAFENMAVPLVPPTDENRARMIRSSRWGGSKNLVELTNVPAGRYSVFLYVWEDNNAETFDVLVNGRTVLRQYNSGSAGRWARLGPWITDVRDGLIRIGSLGGAANFSGIEVWSGEHDGADPSIETPENLAFFESRIRPLLVEHCYSCHAVDADEVQGEFLLDSRAAIRKGGPRGPAVVPHEPGRSVLMDAIRYKNTEMQMPPEGKLSDEQIADLERWIRLGAPDPRHQPTRIARKTIDFEEGREFWSLKPVADPAPPQVRAADWPRNDLDRFILARLEAAGVPPASDVGRAALLRRVTYDLTGLPPTPEERAAFEADTSPEAYAKVVERLLDSPQYGERWGRYWLDVVRYSDTAGDNSDFPIPQMYRYRNWVIGAFNRDLPFDQFVREQLAGDLLPGGTDEERRQRTIATGYIANARRFGSRVDDYPQHLTIEDTLDNVGRAFLGLTINCARCHDHKFDPISTEDYYGLYGIFQSTRYPWPGIELEQRQRDLVPLCSAQEVEAYRNSRRSEEEPLRAQVKRLEKDRDAAKDDDRKRLEGEVKKARELLETFLKQPVPYDEAYAVAEGAAIDDAAVQRRGDPQQAGDIIPRRFLTVMGGRELPSDDRSSGRRQLAEWIVDPANPLTARVLANRLWLYHFGKGLVATPNDFGRQGRQPTHPELLDWLATRLVQSGWSIKALHRTILLSRTYQLASVPGDVALQKDPTNELLSAYPSRRLDADAIRDTLLALGGNLDLTSGGPHPFPAQTEWKFTQHNPFKAVYETNRRSVYLMTQRIQRHPYLAIFDGADPAASTPVRGTSTTPIQALYLLNDPFVHEQAKRFAERIFREGNDDPSRIRRAYRLALGREPRAEELELGQQFLVSVRETTGGEPPAPLSEQDAWFAYVRALFRLNEFVYLD